MSENLDERWARRAWEIRGGRDDSYLFALLDWLAAQHARDQLVSVAAYFLWVNRGRPFGEPLKDWFAAEDEIASDRTAQWQASVDQCLRDQLIAEAAYFHWVNRGRPFGESWKDWSAAEAEFEWW